MLEANLLSGCYRLHFPHCFLSHCGPYSILSVRVHSAPSPGEPRGSLSLVCSWFSATLSCRQGLISMRRRGLPTWLCSRKGCRSRVRPWELCLDSQRQKSKPGQAKLCLFQTLCRKLTQKCSFFFFFFLTSQRAGELQLAINLGWSILNIYLLKWAQDCRVIFHYRTLSFPKRSPCAGSLVHTKPKFPVEWHIFLGDNLFSLQYTSY